MVLPEELKHWPFELASTRELARAENIPMLVAALASRATLTSSDEREPDLYGGPMNHTYHARQIAAEALDMIGPDAAVAIPALLDAWSRERDAPIAHAMHTAILELARFGHAEQVIAALAKDRDRETRKRFAKAAATLGAPGIRALFELAADRDAEVRAASLYALREHARVAEVMPVLERARRDEDREVRWAAARGLVALAPLATKLDVLCEELAADRVPAVMVIEQLVALGPPAAIAAGRLAVLLEREVTRRSILRDDHPRDALIAALANVGPHASADDRSAARRALASAYARSPEIGHHIVAALRALGPPSAPADVVIATLVLRGTTIPMTAAVIRLLGGDPQPRLLELLQAADEPTRAGAAFALADGGNPSVLPALREMLAREKRDPSTEWGDRRRTPTPDDGAWVGASEAIAILEKLSGSP